MPHSWQNFDTFEKLSDWIAGELSPFSDPLELVFSTLFGSNGDSLGALIRCLEDLRRLKFELKIIDNSGKRALHETQSVLKVNIFFLVCKKQVYSFITCKLHHNCYSSMKQIIMTVAMYMIRRNFHAWLPNKWLCLPHLNSDLTTTSKLTCRKLNRWTIYYWSCSTDHPPRYWPTGHS